MTQQAESRDRRMGFGRYCKNVNHGDDPFSETGGMEERKKEWKEGGRLEKGGQSVSW